MKEKSLVDQVRELIRLVTPVAEYVTLKIEAERDAADQRRRIERIHTLNGEVRDRTLEFAKKELKNRLYGPRPSDSQLICCLAEKIVDRCDPNSGYWDRDKIVDADEWTQATLDAIVGGAWLRYPMPKGHQPRFDEFVKRWPSKPRNRTK